MEKKKICVLYPIGDCLHPITGGQLYDSYLFNKIASFEKLQITYFTDAKVGHINKWLLPICIWKHRLKIVDSYAVLLNSGWFAQALVLILLFRIFYPKLKICIIHHHFRYQEMSGMKKYVGYVLEKCCLGLSTVIITPNLYTRSIIERILPHKNIFFLGMSFKKEKHPCSCYETNRLLFVGTVYPRKGIAYLLKALGIMTIEERKGIQLDVVGNLVSADYYNDMQALVSKYGLENIVNFVGRVSDAELNSYYSQAYCFVFPSLLEGYGMVLIEAMSYGLPVIAFDNSAIPYTVKTGKNGILVENKNAEALKEAILCLCNNTDYHHKLCKGALETYHNTRSLSDLDADIEKFVNIELI